MKLRSMITVGALFLGLNALATDLEQELTDKVMNSLEQEGLLDNLSGQDVQNTQDLMAIVVSQNLENSDLNLMEGSKQESIFDSIGDAFKSVGNKIAGAATSAFDAMKNAGGQVWDRVKNLPGKVVDIAKKLGPQALDFAKTVAGRVGPLVQKFGPALVNMAGKFNPKYAAAADLLMAMVPGLTPQQAQGAVASVQGDGTKSDDQAVADALAMLNAAAPK